MKTYHQYGVFMEGQTKKNPEAADTLLDSSDQSLYLINDDVHTFDYVIDALIEVCNHSTEQAEQCALITHYKGRCEVLKAPVAILKGKRRQLVERALRAEIN